MLLNVGQFLKLSNFSASLTTAFVLLFYYVLSIKPKCILVFVMKKQNVLDVASIQKIPSSIFRSK